MYSGHASWFWLDNACDKVSTDLVILEAIVNVEWLNYLVDWANNSLGW